MYLQISKEKEILASELECSQTILLKSAEIFIHALQLAALQCNHRNQYYVNHANGHLYYDEDNAHTFTTEVHSSSIYSCCCKFHLGKTESADLKNVCLEKVRNDTEQNFTPTVAKDISEACQSRCLVLDNYTVCVNALKTAVLTASTVLKIGQVISNC